MVHHPEVEGGAKEASACPFAVAMQEDESDTSSVPDLLNDWQTCPAFTNKECPFKGLAAAEVSQKLKQMPPSHLETNGAFLKTLTFLHKAVETVPLDMECPVKAELPPDVSFDTFLEAYSLASFMGKQAREWEDDAANSSSEEFAVPRLLVTSVSASSTATTHPRKGGHRPSLSEALKQGTSVAHEAAESVHFVKNFIRGQIDRQLYGLLVAQLFHVYRGLEQALDHHAPDHFAACHFPHELSRSQALHEDVEFWHTSDCPPISPAAQDYLDRIQYLAANKPLLLLAHAYTRYLGDLSGGKILGRVARRALNLSVEDPGLAFYEFDHVKSYKLFKDKYRNCLNSLDLSSDAIAEIVQEANIAFFLNVRLFEELDVAGGVPGSSVRPLHEVYHKVLRSSVASQDFTGSPADEAQCPFIAEKKNKAATQRVQSVPSSCPWPFILLHNPKAGMKQWQTWLLIGLLLVYTYQLFMS
eukprot:Nitzschia sp. Nitz4//scaffold30_size153850//22912//24327//NITZ4_002762-RA/size153850-processed-gene-0.4-mRNA-1//1//CDS//3329547214//55//frame0